MVFAVYGYVIDNILYKYYLCLIIFVFVVDEIYSMPFDESTPIGFLISLVLQSCGGYTFMLVLMSIILFYMGFYFYVVAFTCDVQAIFDKMDTVDGIFIKKQLVDALQLHAKFSKYDISYTFLQPNSITAYFICSLTKEATKILSGPIFFMLIFNVAFIALSLFQIEVVCYSLYVEWTDRINYN